MTAHRLCCVLFDIDILCIVIIVELGRNNVLLHSCLVFSHEGLGREEGYLSPNMNVVCPGRILMISADSPGRDQCNLTDSKVALCTT